MGIEEERGRIFPSGWGAATKPCDSCKSAAPLVFCRVESAFLCLECDERLHKTTSGHERVWMCDVCEQAPAAVTCKADAAALCVACDRDIHSANPLARRHDRIPVVPFYVSATAVLKPPSAAATAGAVVPSDVSLDDDGDHNLTIDEAEEAEAASWILPNPHTSNQKFAEDLKPAELFFGDGDPFLDFQCGASMDGRFQHHNSGGSDGVVPVQNKALAPSLINHRASERCFDIDLCRSKLSSYSSLSQSVSSDVGVVPDGNTMSDVSYPFGKQISGVDATGSTASNQSNPMCGSSDREARVLRYREKRKNRKFEKTIRYASRKAYAETRPRIKGRFAKRTEVEAEVDRIYTSVSAAFVPDSGYGVVPSF